jgi:SAM-dependent methyltransferase
VVADVGCGNGKYFGVRQDIAVLASDRSASLVQGAQQKVLRPSPGQPALPAADVFIADGMALPYRRHSCDAALCIAVLHHISSPDRRRTFLKRLRDILTVGGVALVTVWATQQEKPASTVDKWTPLNVGEAADDTSVEPQCRVAVEGQREGGECEAAADYFVPWHLPFHRAGAHLAAAAASAAAARTNSSERRLTEEEVDQASVPEAAVGVIDNSKKTVMFSRYYHLFAEGELSQLAESIDGVVVRRSFYDASNWVIDFERVS